MKDYKFAKLNNKNGDLSKRWFVYYFYKHPETGKFERFQIMISSRLKTTTARTKDAREQINVINEKLINGFNPFAGEIPTEQNLIKAVNAIVEMKVATLRRKTGHTYTVIGRKFTNFLRDHKMHTIKCCQFTPNHAYQFSDYLISKTGISNTTFNNNLTIMRAIFNELIEREQVIKNPFVKVKMLPFEESSKKAFTRSEIKRLYDYLRANDPEMLLICEIIFYCGYRVSEVLSLQVRDIDLDNNILRVQAKNHKNRRSRGIPISGDFRNKFLKYKKYRDDFYLFSSSLLPGEEAGSYNVVQKRFQKVQKKLGIKRTIYELKHTMATRLITEDVHPMEVQNYLGHTNIENTLKYIRMVKETNSTKVQKFIPHMRDF